MNADVLFPQLRSKVVQAVDALAEPYRPDPSALDSPAWTSRFEMIFDLLYESVDLVDDPQSAVGSFLKTPSEAQVMSELTALLVNVVDEAEKYAADFDYPTDEEYQRAPTWPKVVACARIARKTLAE